MHCPSLIKQLEVQAEASKLTVMTLGHNIYNWNFPNCTLAWNYIFKCIIDVLFQTHTALGRAIETWELTSGQQYPNRNSIIHGYLHFEALTDHDYNFSCVRCGHHPPVVVMDLHKSLAGTIQVVFAW